MANFQRDGAESNTQVGRDFEVKVRAFFAQQGLHLQPNFSLEIGVDGRAKRHCFDLGEGEKRVIVECKSHTWTAGWNVPRAKMTTWNQAMYFFHAAPKEYRKILFVLRHYNPERQQTLAEYYIKTNRHLIPDGVEVWEFDETKDIARQIGVSA